MAANEKTDLLHITEKEFRKLQTLISAIEPDLAMRKIGEVSIKDIVGHRAHWIELFLGWYHDGLVGKPVSFPAEGYKWNDLKRYNADLRERQADLDWPGACALLQRNHDRLIGFIRELSQSKLYGARMQGARNDWPSGRWAEAAGASHYRSATKFIRSVLRSRE